MRSHIAPIVVLLGIGLLVPTTGAAPAQDGRSLVTMVAVSSTSTDRFAVAVREDGGHVVDVYEDGAFAARYDNASFGYRWLYAIAADGEAGDRFLAVYADRRVARLVRLALRPDGVRILDRAPLDLVLHPRARVRLELASVHDLDVGKAGRIYLTGSAVEIRESSASGGRVATGRHPTVLVELELVTGPDGETRAVVGRRGRGFAVVDEDARHYRVAADRASGHVYVAPLDGTRVSAWRPFPRGFAAVDSRSFAPDGDAIVDIAAWRGVIAVADRGAGDPRIALYERGRVATHIAAAPGTAALAFFAGDVDGIHCTGRAGGVLLAAAETVTRHRWCVGVAPGTKTAAR